MMVIRISTENRAADRSNQPNPKSYAPRKLALDKEKYLNYDHSMGMFVQPSNVIKIIQLHAKFSSVKFLEIS